MGSKGRTLGQIAQSRHGVVTRPLLLAAGFSDREIQRRRESGELIVEYRGVYRVGHAAPSVHARYLAAVYACGDGAVLSHCAAAHLYGLLKGPPPAPEVTAPTERNVRGVITHRSRRIDATRYERIPITTVPRTLVDVASTLTAEVLARAFHEASIRRSTTPAQVEAVLARRPTTPHAAKLRLVIHGDIPALLSHLERRFLTLLRAHALPLPITNREAGKHYVDCRWPEHHLTVELDSYTFHNTRHAWEHDHRREREAYARGDDFRRYTYDDVTQHHQAVVEELTPLLRAPARTPSATAPSPRAGRSRGRSARSPRPARR
jgi:very-short-patch-repair endonuclease